MKKQHFFCFRFCFRVCSACWSAQFSSGILSIFSVSILVDFTRKTLNENRRMGVTDFKKRRILCHAFRPTHTPALAKISFHPPIFYWRFWKNRANIKVGVGKAYDVHVVKGISKTTIFEKKMMLFHRDYIKICALTPVILKRPADKVRVLEKWRFQLWFRKKSWFFEN